MLSWTELVIKILRNVFMKILVKTAVWLLCILLSNTFSQSACGKERVYKPVIAAV